MKKLILIISMAFACTLASAQQNTDKTLYIIDGAVSTKTAVDQIPPDAVTNMNVIKGVESVVVITTKNAAQNAPKISIRTSDSQSENGTLIQSTTVLNYTTLSPLCIVKKPNGELSKGDMQGVSPDTIKSILVYKDEQAEPYKKYGDISNGVVLIELK